jgi:hypothetical protein
MSQNLNQVGKEEPSNILNREEPSSLEERFIKLSKEYDAEKELYDKEVLDIKNEIQKLEEEIAQLKKEESENKEAPKEEGVLSIDNTEKVENVVEDAIATLPQEEKAILVKEMEETNPEDFENPKVKTNFKMFFKNQIVKKLSGFNFPEKVKKILRGPTDYILMTTAILVLWPKGTEGTYPTPNNPDNKKDITILKEKTVKESNAKTYHPFTKTEKGENIKLPERLQDIYSYATENIHDSYIIVDKPTATMYVFNENKELVTTMPVLLGQTKGERPNISDPEVDVAIGATTPAGKYHLGRVGIGNETDLITYQGRIMPILDMPGGAVHMVYPKEKKERDLALKTPTIKDNNKTYGCINISSENFDKYISPNFKKGNQIIFITPDNPNLSINPNSGKIEGENVNDYYANNTAFDPDIKITNKI